MSGTAEKDEDVRLFKVGNQQVWICNCGPYNNMAEIFALGRQTDLLAVHRNGGFLIDEQCLLDVINQPSALSGMFQMFVGPPAPEAAMRQGAGSFAEFFREWQADTLTLVREFTTDHFSWPALVANPSTLESEGLHDLPTFTMGNAQKTRWIPTAYYPKYPDGIGGIALSGCKGRVMDFLTAVGAWVPIGVYVTIPAGRSRAIKLAWLNEGETVVRGPLAAAAFRVDKMICARKNPDFDFKVIDVSDIDVTTLPQRPYIESLPDLARVPALQTWWGLAAVTAFRNLIAPRLV